MRLALIGYGKMGKEIERLALGRGWSVGVRVDLDTPPPDLAAKRAVDVAIHFAHAKTIVADLRLWAELGKPIVVGTTGWRSDLQHVQNLVRDKGIGLVHAPNFSLGVNIFYQLARAAATMFDRFEDYDVFIHEVHHKDKVDSPSGTALTLAEIVLSEIKRKKEVLAQSPPGKIRPDQLHVSFTRGGAVIGTHSLTFDSAADSIEVRHAAKNRTGFALGALLAAEWIQGKKGMYTMEDVIHDLFRHT
jgi:4-hydroxy-tetrahydrodipicolinate reductase